MSLLRSTKRRRKIEVFAMYCEHCGMLIGNPGEPCPVCGRLQTSVPGEQAPLEEPVELENTEFEQNGAQQEAESAAGENREPVDARAGRAILILGIVGLILGGSVYLSIPGVVVSAVSLYRSAALAGTATGRTAAVKSGTVLGWIGMILGTLLTLAAVVFLGVVSRYALR